MKLKPTPRVSLNSPCELGGNETILRQGILTMPSDSNSSRGAIPVPGQLSPAAAVRRFLNLTTEQEVMKALVDTGAILTGRRQVKPDEIPPEKLEDFKRSWGLKTEDEVAEAIAMTGLVMVSHGDLADAARNAKYPLTVAKAIAGATRGMESQLRRVVSVLRERGHSWTEIGSALGITKQSAWERFSGEDP